MGTAGGDHEVTVPFVPGTWQRLTVIASTGSEDGGAGSAEVDVDGQMVASAPFTAGELSPDGSVANTYAALDFGSTVDKDVVTDVMELDDVVMAYR